MPKPVFAKNIPVKSFIENRTIKQLAKIRDLFFKRIVISYMIAMQLKTLIPVSTGMITADTVKYARVSPHFYTTKNRFIRKRWTYVRYYIKTDGINTHILIPKTKMFFNYMYFGITQWKLQALEKKNWIQNFEVLYSTLELIRRTGKRFKTIERK